MVVVVLRCRQSQFGFALCHQVFATFSNAGSWQCLCAIMHVNGDMVSASAEETASFPLSMGGLGLRSAF